MIDATSRMIFIGGLQRSGTTLLGRLLASHPSVAGLVGTPTDEDEGQFVQDVYPDDHIMGRPDGGVRGRPNHWAYHPEARLTEADLRSRPHTASRLSNAWSPYWSRSEASQFVEKSPSNVMKTRFLQAAFPQSRFVTITRHPVSQSLAIRKWVDLRHRVGLDFGQLIDHWLTAMDAFAHDQSHLDHAIVIRYEELLADGAGVMRRLNDFLDLPTFDYDVSELADRDAIYRDYWRRARTRGAVFTPLNPPGRLPHRGIRAIESAVMRTIGRRDLERVVARYENRIEAHGYSFDDFGQD